MHFSEAARTNNESLPCRECNAIQITRAMNIVVFQLHVRGWVDGGHRTRARHDESQVSCGKSLLKKVIWRG